MHLLDRVLTQEKKEGKLSTPGMKKAMKGLRIKTRCPFCSQAIPKYVGSYPKFCPQCGKPLNTSKKEDVAQVTDLIGTLFDGKKSGSESGGKRSSKFWLYKVRKSGSDWKGVVLDKNTKKEIFKADLPKGTKNIGAALDALEKEHRKYAEKITKILKGEAKDQPGKRDGTGPYKGSFQAKRKKGKRGGPCGVPGGKKSTAEMLDKLLGERDLEEGGASL